MNSPIIVSDRNLRHILVTIVLWGIIGILCFHVRAFAAEQSKNWLDTTQETVSKTVSGVTRRFDSFFGSSEHNTTRDYTHGQIDTGVWWDEKDEYEFPIDVHLNLSLPNMERRVNAFLGKIRVEEFLTDSSSMFEAMPSSFQSLAKKENDWLIGLGYSPIKNKRNRLDFDAGVNLKLDAFTPFLKTRYRYNLFMGPRVLLRIRPTGYWQSDDGFGTSLSSDLDFALSSASLMQWANFGNISEGTSGMHWWSEFNLFHHLGRGRGIVYSVKISGETEDPVKIKEYGTGVVYRQPLYKQWMFGSLATSLTWPRDAPEEKRKAVKGIGVSLEMRFGEQPEE
ncbi:hypothetical protein CSA56_16520 [candidate division KSB3 bacterium]|uniref:Uncharacterized protein n=1 Tax=candidate division KSB3 bacterium TaxID=2044937 RepID=A0A2G6K9M9_9BACT|nr:MAG: hypothetical protein CSA56_16520 [candidate division KSB3 bacterium]